MCCHCRRTWSNRFKCRQCLIGPLEPGELSDPQTAQPLNPTEPNDAAASIFFFRPHRSEPDCFMLLRQCKIPTIQHIPKQARTAFTRNLTELIYAATQDPTNLNGHARLQMFSNCVLRHDSGKKSRNAQAKYTMNFLQRWEQSEEGKLELWRELLTYRPPEPKQNSRTCGNKLRRCRKLVQLGRLSDACKSLLSEDTLEFTDEVVAKLEELHPAVTPITFQKLGQCEALEVTYDLVRQMIKTFPKGTACSCDGLRAQHLADGLSVGCLAGSCIAAFTSLVNLYLAANLPLDLAPPRLWLR